MRVLVFLLVFLSACKVEEARWVAEAKPKIRWWWMGSDVDSVGIQQELREFQKVGIGGVEITPIYGVKGREEHYRPYLSRQWITMYEYTVQEAKKWAFR